MARVDSARALGSAHSLFDDDPAKPPLVINMAPSQTVGRCPIQIIAASIES